MLKNKSVKNLLAIIFILILIASNINAVKLSNNSKKDDLDDYGSISGSVIIHCFPPPEYITGAKLVLKREKTTRNTFSGLLGNFRFNLIPIGWQYTLTVTHSDFKTVEKTFTLLPEDLDMRISIAMLGKDSKSKNNKDIVESGTIYGYIGSIYIWGFTPVPFALVDAGMKKTVSAYPLGGYSLNDLPFDQEITVTASKIGYKSDTIKLTLTKEKTSYYVFDLQEKEDDKKSKEIRKDLLSFATFCSDTWSNFFSTTAFIH